MASMHFKKHGNGPPVVLLHGLGASVFSWRDVVTALSPKYTTYAVDLIGFGESLPAPDGFGYTMAAQAQAVLDFLSAERIANPILIGHSMGGGTCLHLVDMARNTRAPLSNTLVLIAPVAFPPVVMFPKIGQGNPLGLLQSPAELILGIAYAPGNKPTKPQIDGYAAGLRLPQLPAFTAHAHSLSTTEKPLPSFAGITNKTLVVWGDQETILKPSHGDKLTKTLSRATLHTIKNSGHIPHEEQPKATIAAISNFLP